MTALRVAISSPASKVGSLASQPARPRPGPGGVPGRPVAVPGVEARLPRPPASPGPAGCSAGSSSSTSSGTQKVSSGGRPRSSLVGRISAAPEGVPVGLGGVGEVGRGPADVAAQDDQRRPVLHGHGPAQGRLEGVGVVGHLADVVDVPAVGGEPLGHVVGVGELGRAVDRDVVVVVDVDQAAQAEVAGQRGRLVGDALLEAAVAGEDEGVVVDQLGAEPGPQDPLGDAHAHAVGEPLAEGPGGHLHPGGVAVLGVAGGPRAPLPEGLEVVEGEAVAGQDRASSTRGSRRGRWRGRTGPGRARSGRSGRGA